jgi:hypothetical protein
MFYNGFMIRCGVGFFTLAKRIGSILVETKDGRQRTKKHIQRMDGTFIPNQATTYKVYGKRDVGRLRNSWRGSEVRSEQPNF